jgi:hypothetical protein
MMFRSENTIVTQLNFCNKVYLANASLVSEQTQVGVVTLPNDQGYVALMLDFLEYSLDTDIFDQSDEVILDYTLINN